MKLIRSRFLAAAVGTSLITLVGTQQAGAVTPFEALELQMLAVEQTSPLPASAVPIFGSFHSAQRGPLWPPLPYNFYELPVWVLHEGCYVLDDRNVDYAELYAQAEAAALLSMALNGSLSAMANSLLNRAYAYGNGVYLTNLAVVPSGNGDMTASFSIAGATNFVPYDILMSTNAALSPSQWTWLGLGYTSNDYTYYGQPTNMAFYILAKPQRTMTVGWGDDSAGQCDVPAGLTNALAAASGGAHCLAVLSDGTVAAWGTDYYGRATIPTNVVGATMVAAGWYHSVALLTNGAVLAWGMNGASLGWHLTEVPADLTNATVISAQALHTLALRSNGTVVAWGDNSEGQGNVPAGLSNATAIAAGGEHSLAVSNGFVVAWGCNLCGQTDVPAGLSDVWDVAAGWEHSVALKRDGTVVCWGDDYLGQSTVPAGLSNVVAIAAGGDPYWDTGYSLALRADGTVVAWG